MELDAHICMTLADEKHVYGGVICIEFSSKAGGVRTIKKNQCCKQHLIENMKILSTKTSFKDKPKN